MITTLKQNLTDMLAEAQAAASIETMTAGVARQIINGVEVVVVKNPVNTNSKRLLQTLWTVDGKKVAAAKVEDAIVAAASRKA